MPHAGLNSCGLEDCQKPKLERTFRFCCTVLKARRSGSLPKMSFGFRVAELSIGSWTRISTILWTLHASCFYFTMQRGTHVYESRVIKYNPTSNDLSQRIQSHLRRQHRSKCGKIIGLQINSVRIFAFQTLSVLTWKPLEQRYQSLFTHSSAITCICP